MPLLPRVAVERHHRARCSLLLESAWSRRRSRSGSGGSSMARAPARVMLLLATASTVHPFAPTTTGRRPALAPSCTRRGRSVLAASAAGSGYDPAVPGSYDPERIRNFCIIAHIDHGKSTLADRLLQTTKTVTDREMDAADGQLLDNMDIERERGITIKMQAARMNYKAQDGKWYVLNLIDTPGHVDFTYEVSRSIQACEGALLVVDASQGVEAQTIANVYLAMDGDLEIVPVLNKIDLPGADVDMVSAEVEGTIGLDCTDAIPCSAKMGLGIDEILEAIVKRVPPPAALAEEPLRALIFDSYYDPYKGIIVFFRIVDGCIKSGDKVRFINSKVDHDTVEIGVLTPNQVPKEYLMAGEVRLRSRDEEAKRPRPWTSHI